VALKADVPTPNPIALNRARQSQPESKGVLGWLSFGMLNKSSSTISTDTGAASITGGQLSIDPGKP
jgi:hypothetical protein